ncbi:hypothetical protein OKW43_005379 [Paraburkholderia sp. WC7.3g]|uniref:hypothetical protein n=1 Tax=Paraburkholderia sp. WC7.3g TaxID=2991070 RepID=UPI003D1D0C15
MVNRSFADMRRTPVSPALVPGFFLNGFTWMFNLPNDLHREFTYAADDGGLLFRRGLMTGVIVFVGVWVIALALLLRFAARIDPRSGRLRRR